MPLILFKCKAVSIGKAMIKDTKINDWRKIFRPTWLRQLVIGYWRN